MCNGVAKGETLRRTINIEYLLFEIRRAGVFFRYYFFSYSKITSYEKIGDQ